MRPMPPAPAHCLDSFGLLYELLQGEWDQKMWKDLERNLRILARQISTTWKTDCSSCSKTAFAAMARTLRWGGVVFLLAGPDSTWDHMQGLLLQEHEELLAIRLKKYYGSYPMSTYQVTLCSVNHERRNHGNMSWKGCSNLKPLKPYG